MGTVSAARRAFYAAIDAENMAPLWEVLGDLVPPTPRTPCVPCHWDWAVCRARLMQAGQLITAQEAERRVLVLENPGRRGASAATHSLYAGLQLILPGEIAPAHRHTATAVRLILEGEGAYTSVNGERTPMHVGDFVITPSWTFHDHGNPGPSPVIWLDGLDVPIVQLFDAAFSEHGGTDLPPPARATDDSLARYAGNLLPVDYQPGLANPMFRYPYEQTRGTLERLLANGPVDPVHAVKMRFAHPGTGGWPTPTMGAFMQLLPAGFAGLPYRSTDAAVFCVLEGEGYSEVGGTRIAWGLRDVFVVPSWMPVRHVAAQQAVLFSMSDRPAQLALGLWREARE
ncbi:MAG: gentisate 1,2-dioxygenase [Polaromonas sp.]|nr:gentisate 1,2-dioxygenase [Polaromonas sp.]